MGVSLAPSANVVRDELGPTRLPRCPTPLSNRGLLDKLSYAKLSLANLPHAKERAQPNCCYAIARVGDAIFLSRPLYSRLRASQSPREGTRDAVCPRSAYPESS